MPGKLTIALLLALIGLAAGAPLAAADPTLPSNDPFYTPPGDLASAAPGTVLRTRTVPVAESGNSTPVTATQVLYRTTTELGQPSATVATIIAPATQPVSTKIVSYQTAYDGLGPTCRPSYTLQGGNSSYSTAQDEEQLILAYVAAGDTVVVPDYEGENDDWAAGQEEGYNTLDGVRAAENVLGVPAGGTPVGLVGYSGGSIATDFAAELAPTYAPELHIVGAAEGGVPVDFFHNLNYINGDTDWAGVIPAVLDSLARAFHVSFAQDLSPYGIQVTNQVKDECINSFAGNYPGLTIQKLLKPQDQDPFKNPDFVRIGDQLIMGRTGTPKVPMFIGVGNVDGTGDTIMIANDVEALAHEFCQRGVSVQFNVYQGDDHTNAAVPFEAGAQTFLNTLLAGGSEQNGCSSIGTGNSLDPLPIPSAAPTTTVKLRVLGVRHHLHGFVIRLATSSGTARHLVVTLRRGRHVVARVRLGRLGKRWRRVVLRHRGRIPARGRYTVRVSAGATMLVTRRIRVR